MSRDLGAQTVEEAFEDHRQAQRIRQAIVLVGDDEALRRVLDAAEKYAEYLEFRAYNGPCEHGYRGENQ